MKHKTIFPLMCVMAALTISLNTSYAQGDKAPPRTPDMIREFYQSSPGLTAAPPGVAIPSSTIVTSTLPSQPALAWDVLAFETFRNNNWDIYTRDSRVNGEVRLTNESSIEVAPSLSRGAQYAAYASKRDGNYEIYRINTDGTNMQRLTYDPSTDTAPAWSPDGNRIAFQSARTGNVDVFVMNADGTSVIQLTTSGAYDGEPSWSPDGSRLVFVSQRTGRYELWVMDANGTNQTQLTVGATAFDPAWSPDGQHIAYSNDSDGDGWLEVWLINSDGTGASLFYSLGYPKDVHAPAWSPDGQWLHFVITAWIYYQGNWYWTDSYLFYMQVNPPGPWASPGINDNRVWSADWASADMVPPQPCVVTGPSQAARWNFFGISWAAQDNGLWDSGVASYEVQARSSATSPWADVTSKSLATSLLYEGPDSGTVDLRCRARDVVGNQAAWASAPVTTVSVDAVRPQSTVTVAARAITNTQFSVGWSGTDQGTGLASYDVFTREDTLGDWAPWLQNVTSTTAVFQGAIGHTYFFQSQAQDQVGHREPWRPDPKAAVTLYSHSLAGTLRDNRGVVALATPLLQPSALYSTTDDVAGAYDLYLGASGVYTLEVNGNGYGNFPPTPLTITSDETFDVVLPPASNALTNSGFENGNLDGWSWAGDGISVTTQDRYAGNYGLLISPTVTGILEVSQSLTIEASLHEPTLSLMYRVPAALDGGSLAVEVMTTTSTELWSTSAATVGWQHAWVDLAPYSGQTVTVTIRLSGTVELVSLDEVSVGSWTTPQLLEVTPTEWIGPATLILTGTNFISAPIVFLGDVPLTDAAWISSTQIQVDVPLTMPVGQYDLRLANPGGAATHWPGPLTVKQHMVWLPMVASSRSGIVVKETTDWLTLGGNPGRTGYRRLDSGASRYALAWTATLPYSGGRPLAQIAVADGVVAAITDGFFAPSAVVALNADTGQELWRYEFSGKYSLNPPAIGHGAVYVQEGNHASDSYLFSLDLYTGQKKWQAPFAAQWETYLAPLVVGSGVYVNAGYYGGMYGFDAGSGSQLWFTSLEQISNWAPSYANGKVYSWTSNYFREHDLATGATLWSVAGSGGTNTAPVVDQRTGLVASSTALTAFDLGSHTIRWAVSGNHNATLPAMADDVVYALNAHVLEARQLSDGALLWSFVGDNGLTHAPIIAGPYVYVASEANTYVVNRDTHTLVWQVNHGGWLSMANGYLYVAQADKIIYAYKAQEP